MDTPQVGDIWMWYGGQHFFLLKQYQPYKEFFLVLELETGVQREMSFIKRMIADKSWTRVA
jgi:hypothetical protein